jgi:hypothetical protein
LSSNFFKEGDIVFYGDREGQITSISNGRYPIEAEFLNEKGQIEIGYFGFDGLIKHGDGTPKRLIKKIVGQ